MAQARYAELHAWSNFSFLEGASHPEELVARGRELGLEALALTDRDGLYGAVRFAKAARGGALGAICGAELTLDAPELRPRRATLTPAELARFPRLVLLAEDTAGYANLARARSRRHRCAAASATRACDWRTSKAARTASSRSRPRATASSKRRYCAATSPRRASGRSRSATSSRAASFSNCSIICGPRTRA